MKMVKDIIKEIKSFSDEERATHSLRFFKTGKGEYAEGDKFYGLKVPDVRKIAKEYYMAVNLEQLEELIKNPYHEVRLVSLIMLVMKYPKATEKEKQEIYNFYLDHTDSINNWDLVDLSAPNIVGAYLYNKDTSKLFELAKTDHLWNQRISILATFYFIKQGSYETAIELIKYFLNNKHDLIQKASGWMLREVGKKDLKVLYAFLDEYYKVMPRTMLRYALEKLTPEKRQHYMKK